MTVYVFPRYTYHDQERYIQRHLKKPLDKSAHMFTTHLAQLNNYLPMFPPDTANQVLVALPTEEVKDILYHGMPTAWQMKTNEQGYSYLEDNITLQNMADFFETRCDNLEESTSSKKRKSRKSLKGRARLRTFWTHRNLLKKRISLRSGIVSILYLQPQY